jgi:phosphoglycolate phosphatase
MALPYSATTKGVVWFILFGLAKAAQYTGLVIVGVEGWRRVKAWFRRDKKAN